jgi:outer membrane protein TolC
VQQAEARLKQLRALVDNASAAMLPSASVEAQAGRVYQSLDSGLGTLSNIVPNYPRAVDADRLALGGAWDLDFAGSLRAQREGARATLAATYAERDTVRLSVSAEVASAYLQLAAARRDMVALQRRVELLLDQRTVMEKRARVGAASQDDVDRLTAMESEARASLPGLAGLVASLEVRLAVLRGRDPSSSDRVVATQAEVPLAADPTGGAPADVLRQRPDVRSAEARLAASRSRVQVAMSEYYPKLSLSAAVGFDSAQSSLLGQQSSVFGQGILGLRWRLFDFKRIDAEIASAKGQEQEALAGYRAAILRAGADVENSFSDVLRNRERLAVLEAQQQLARKRLATVQRAWQAGASSRDDTLGAEQEALRLDTLVNGARRDVALAIVGASRSLGQPIPSAARKAEPESATPR